MAFHFNMNCYEMDGWGVGGGGGGRVDVGCHGCGHESSS